MSMNRKELESLQIRRPNKLFTKPLKKHLEILYDILAFNFYVRNPNDTEFRISWVQLQKEFGVNTTNKASIIDNLNRLQEENLISHLHTWSDGFSYRFENTWISYDEVKKPEQYTFLDVRVMQKLTALEYKLYVLAYKFYDFTRYRSGETKYLEIDDFLKLFIQSSAGKSTVHQVKNRLLTQLRRASKRLEDDFNIDIELFFKKFGRPITHVKIKFHKVPKLKEIISKFVSLALLPEKVKKSYTNYKKKEKSDFEISEAQKVKEEKELKQGAILNAKKKFLTEVYFPKIAETTSKKFESTREWIKKNYPDFELPTLKHVEHHFNYFYKNNGFYKAFDEGVLKKEDFSEFREDGNSRVFAKFEASHPILTTFKVQIPILSLW